MATTHTFRYSTVFVEGQGKEDLRKKTLRVVPLELIAAYRGPLNPLDDRLVTSAVP
jgi:hypothetical protein